MTLRIISGERRGAKLATPEGMDTRPLRDRVRQALFNKLRPVLRDARVLDAFAGSGAVGLEAISNGASSVVFVEPTQAALRVLRENIKKLRFEERCVVLEGQSPAALKGVADSFDMLFLMPPYHSGLCGRMLVSEPIARLTTQNCLAICEVHREETFDAPSGWKVVDDRLYGITRLVFLEKGTSA